MKPLIVALDVKDDSDALSLARELGDLCELYKVGPSLLLKHGSSLIEKLRWMDKQVFLDLKFHDIPATVARAVETAGKLGVYSVTVHASGGTAMIQAAAAVKPRPKIWAVTVLTSLSDADLGALGCSAQAAEQAARLAALARDAGADGIICSVKEAARIRRQSGKKFTIVTPGIRPPGSRTDDQKRTDTPSAARSGGADFFVVGRPIIEAKDPRKAAEALLQSWKK